MMRTHTKTFHIRFTEKEYDRLCRYAAKAGLPKTTYIRHMINDCQPKENPPPEFWGFMREIHALGNNLNQLTNLAHKFGSLHAAKLDNFSNQYTDLIRAVMQRMIAPDDLDISAVLESGQKISEQEEHHAE
jgi:hypothetical protein